MSSILGFAAQKFGGFWSIFSNSGSIRAALPHPGVSTSNSIHLCQKRGCSGGIKTPFPTGMARGRSSRQELTQVLPFLPLPACSEPFFWCPNSILASKFAPGKKICAGIAPEDGFSQKRMEMSPFPCAAGAAGAGKRKNNPLGRRLRGFFREWGCWERRQDPSDSALGTGKAGIG